MVRFFLHKKFWLPIIALIILATLLEIFLRFGVWNNLVKPKSFLGNVLYRKKAIENFGLDNIDWITIGDSRIDWGLDHGEMLDLQKSNGLNHIRMSFQSSNFMSIQATIDWSIVNMPHLQGIMIGLDENSFSTYSNIKTQHKIAWPFRQYFDYNNYTFFSSKAKKINFWYRTALFVYFYDIKYFLNYPLKRIYKIQQYKEFDHQKVLRYNRTMPTDTTCPYNVQSIEEGLHFAKILANKKGNLTRFEKTIIKIFKNPHYSEIVQKQISYKQQHLLPRKDTLLLTNNWLKLFTSILHKKIKLTVVLLPEHSLTEFTIKKTNSRNILNSVFNKLNSFTNLKIIDLRKIFDNSKQQECALYRDLFHFSKKGKSIITYELLKRFEKKTLHEF